MKNVKAAIITIGDEILIGQIVDTNSAFISRELNKNGIRISKKYSIADSAEAINEALDEHIGKVDVLIFTGGLGPTKDDITKYTLNTYFNGKLVRNEQVYGMLSAYFSSFGREFSEANQGQAMVPDVCRILPNKRGTAPGMLFEKEGTLVFSLPGVPYEMEGLLVEEAIPMIRENFDMPAVIHKTILTQGVPESILMVKIQDWENSLDPRVKLAYLPSPGIVRLRLTAIEHFPEAETYMHEKAEALKPLIGERIFGYDEDTLEGVVLQQLLAKGATVSFAESCTGGYLAHKLTSVPGSSKVFNGSLVAYGYDIKSNMLGVSPEVLMREGAVSEPVVMRMAEGVKEKFGATYAIATSGIAGPDGGTTEKPVGTVWIAVSGPNGSRAQKFRFPGNRLRNIQMTALAGLDMLRTEMQSTSEQG
jgi:nicotinamide-nucleotide amidase